VELLRVLGEGWAEGRGERGAAGIAKPPATVLKDI